MSVAQRRRERRDRLSRNTPVLDYCPQHVGETLTTDEVCELFGVIYDPTLRHSLDRHGDELRADGWDHEAGTFTRRAVLRLAMMFRSSTSLMASRIAKAAEDYHRLIKFTSSPEQVRRADDTLSLAFDLVEQVHDDDPAEVWARLGKLDDYALKSAVVALSALVPEDLPVLGWLARLAPEGAMMNRAAMGLALLLPTPESADGVPSSAISEGLAS